MVVVEVVVVLCDEVEEVEVVVLCEEVDALVAEVEELLVPDDDGGKVNRMIGRGPVTMPVDVIVETVPEIVVTKTEVVVDVV